MRKQTRKWTTKDGHKIRICDMEDNHLVNTIKMLRRFGEHMKGRAEAFYITYPQPQGDMAQYYFDREFDQVMASTYEDYVPETYNNLLMEAERRGIRLEEAKLEGE